jgi:hypothetical protein
MLDLNFNYYFGTKMAPNQKVVSYKFWISMMAIIIIFFLLLEIPYISELIIKDYIFTLLNQGRNQTPSKVFFLNERA